MPACNEKRRGLCGKHSDDVRSAGDEEEGRRNKIKEDLSVYISQKVQPSKA